MQQQWIKEKARHRQDYKFQVLFFKILKHRFQITIGIKIKRHELSIRLISMRSNLFKPKSYYVWLRIWWDRASHTVNFQRTTLPSND